MVDEIVVGLENPAGEPIFAHELPDVFHRIKLGGYRRQDDDGDVGRHDEACRHVPSGLVGQEYGVGAICDGLGDLDKVQIHRLGIASW
jgi:hypothetical protein